MVLLGFSFLVWLAILLMILIFIFYFWKFSIPSLFWIWIRMISQLFFLGFILKYLFSVKNIFLGSLFLLVMLSVAAWIALRPIAKMRKKFYFHTWWSLFLGTFIPLGMLFHVVWKTSLKTPSMVFLPLAGMIFFSAMTAVSLASERYFLEKKTQKDPMKASAHAFKVALIPQTNVFLAVGLVSMPGLMTGQILAGVDPLIAVRYQMMLLGCVFSSAAFSVFLFLFFLRQKETSVVSQSLCEKEDHSVG